MAVPPARPSLTNLRAAAQDCRACPLWADATQTVFGSGLKRASIMLVGEQPGDREDRAGEPFVGPAGGLLRRAIADAGLDERDLYLTNTVKHFRHEERGKRRIHKRPGAEHVRACLPWLHAEIEVVRPEVLVCLGALAAQALLGRGVKVGADRGRDIPCDLAPHATVTAHPSSILRIDDADERRDALDALVADLRGASAFVSADVG